MIVPFLAEHIEEMDWRDVERRLFASVTPAAFAAGALMGEGYSVVVDGRVVAMAGVVPMVADGSPLGDVGHGWALLSPEAARYPREFHRGVLQFLDGSASRWRRIQTTVAGGFETGHRWARRLGFICETPFGMPGYGPGGEPAFMYARHNVRR